MVGRFISFLQFVTVLIVVPFSVITNAQSVQNFNGPLQIGDYKGDAQYTYKIVDNDTVLDGAFVVQRSNLQELLQQKDYSFLFKGAFINGFPNGPWKFQFGDFQSKSSSEIVDYQYRVLVSGTQETALGTIKLGAPDGRWTIVIEEIVESDIVKTLFKSNMQFERGVPQQNFNIQDETYTLAGRFLRNGLAHDEWSLYPVNGMYQTESWYFNDGLLNSVKLRKDGKTESILIYNEPSAKTKVVQLNQAYLQALGMQLPFDEAYRFLNNGLSNLLERNTAQYMKIDQILSTVGKSDFLPEFKVKVLDFPLDSLEIASIETIKSSVSKATEISNFIQSNSQLNILKLSDTSTVLQISAVEKIALDYLRPLQALVAYDSLKILDYTSRAQLIQHLYPKGMPGTQLRVEVELDSSTVSQTFSFPTDKSMGTEQKDLKGLESFAKMVAAGMVEIASDLKAKLTFENKQQELIAVEEQVIFQNESLQTFIDSASRSTPPKYRKALNHLNSFAGNMLKEYSNRKASSNTLATANSIKTCLIDLTNLAHTISKMPAYADTVRTTYTDRIWNPFTATLMDEDVKKRITTAYENVLEPYFLNEIAEGLSCETILELNNTINSTYARIKALRDEETKKLERRLRREQDPLMVLQLMNVQNTLSEQ